MAKLKINVKAEGKVKKHFAPKKEDKKK